MCPFMLTFDKIQIVEFLSRESHPYAEFIEGSFPEEIYLGCLVQKG